MSTERAVTQLPADRQQEEQRQRIKRHKVLRQLAEDATEALQRQRWMGNGEKQRTTAREFMREVLAVPGMLPLKPRVVAMMYMMLNGRHGEVDYGGGSGDQALRELAVRSFRGAWAHSVVSVEIDHITYRVPEFMTVAGSVVDPYKQLVAARSNPKEFARLTKLFKLKVAEIEASVLKQAGPHKRAQILQFAAEHELGAEYLPVSEKYVVKTVGAAGDEPDLGDDINESDEEEDDDADEQE